MSVALLDGLGVSRETFERLQTLESLLGKWNRSINLVSRSTISETWNRHILDSAQLFPADPFDHWADLGAGAGFPGLVVAVLAAEKCPNARISLVEIDQRKATFLREASRQLGVQTSVIVERIEALKPLNVDRLSARALAPLGTLLAYAVQHLRVGGTAIFPKGADWIAEVNEARKSWTFDLVTRPSITGAGGEILVVKEIEHV